MRIHSDDADAAAMEIMGVDQHPQHHSDDGARGVAAVVACATRDVVDDDNDAADAGPAIARDGPGPITTTNTAQHHQPLQQPQAPTTEQQQSSSSSSSPPPAGAPSPSAVPSILSGAPSWLFAHPLMSTLFGDQHQVQQQRRAGESSSSSGAISASTTAAPQLVVSLSSSSPPPSSSSITTPILAHDRHRGRSDDVEEEPGRHDDNDNNCINDKDSINVNKATNVIALTRTHFSSPESRRYHALHNDEEEYIYQPPQQPHSNNDDIHHGSMAMMGRHFGTFSTKNEDATTTASSGDNPKHNSSSSDLFLTHTYPLTLQRSASSAFGCPYSSTSPSSSFCPFKTRARVRTLSNSGYSDPGASAFRPVWR